MEQSLNTHERFEELCALVACGEASQSELAELTGHLRSCAECRGLLNDCAQAATQVLAQESGEVGPVEAPPGMTERFVARARAEGIPIKLPGDVTEALSSSESSGRRTRIMFWAAPILAIVLAALSLKLITAASRSRTSPQTSQSVSTRTIPSEGAISTVASGKEAHKPGDPGAAEELRVARARIAQLEATLRADHRKHESVDEAKAQTVKLEEELANLRSEGDDRGKAALLQGRELAELRTSVTRLTAELDERRQLDATRTAELEENRRLLATLTEARDMITDENVHIWTVHDSDESGKRRQAFGRIIYTEGKRLVFYAYKLPDRKNATSQISFYVWGEKAGTAQPVKSLGTLRIDDAGARRWKLTFEDQDVLTQITSIFVTADSGSKGKKILYAKLEKD